MENVRWILEESSELPLYTLDFKERPSCPTCGILGNVHAYSLSTMKIGLDGPYQIRYKSYKCSNKTCLNYKKKRITPPNNCGRLNHVHDYGVEAKACEFRFKELKTLEEIESDLFIYHDIKISANAVGKIIKRYEIASKFENQAIVLDEIKKRGGTIICMDALHPYIGAGKLLVALDYDSEQCIYVEKVVTEKFDAQKAFQEHLKFLMESHGIPVLGIMSDDNKAQRKAIKAVWGEKIPHCSCLYHFYKQILEKPLELHSKLIKTIRKTLRDIHWVELYRRGEFEMKQETPLSKYLERLIKDLFTLTKWKPGRNNFRLDATKYYERIEYFHHELVTLHEKLDVHGISFSIQEGRIVSPLLLRLNTILIDCKIMHDELASVKISLQKIKKILDDHEESPEDGLKILKKIATNLTKRLTKEEQFGKHERHFIKEFEDFIFGRGQTLFNYREVNERYMKFNKEIHDKIEDSKTEDEKKEIKDKLYVPRTNNSLESRFKLLKYHLKRTLGQHHANRYLLAHGEYILHVNINASFNQIKKILQNANHEEISKEIKRNIIPRLTRFTQIKDDELFKSVMKEYEEMHSKIFANEKKR